MHLADQAVALTKLMEAGQPVSSVAARDLLDVYRADGIDLQILKAFAITSDRERQMAAGAGSAGARPRLSLLSWEWPHP